MTIRKPASREEDFRDDQQRDIHDGWPYADGDNARREGTNAPDGISSADPDRVDDAGMAITSDPAARSVKGEPLPFSENTDDAIADDDLEARILEALEQDERIDLKMLDLTIHDGIAVIRGAVDSEDDRRHLVGFLHRMKGVRDVRAGGLLTRGVDSHVPGDVTG